AGPGPAARPSGRTAPYTGNTLKSVKAFSPAQSDGPEAMRDEGAATGADAFARVESDPLARALERDADADRRQDLGVVELSCESRARPWHRWSFA
ncbi:MAG TPA: hypothetical protein VKG38_07520, partial [Solirubrobacteraceae bacterium]|nr:hypothetical protein [Solirubrobacteraceae bacterium]